MQRLWYMATILVVLALGSASVFAATPTAYRSPAQLRADIAGIAAENRPVADRVVLFKGTQVDVDPSGISTRAEQVAIHILTPAGARDQKVLRFDYDPTTSDVSVQKVSILRLDGGTEEVDLSAVLDFSAPKHWIYWPFRVKLLDLPPLFPGDTVVWETRFRGFQIAYLADSDERFVPPQRGEFFDVVTMGDSIPLVRQVYRITLPADKPLSFTTANSAVFTAQEKSPTHLTYAFWVEGVPPYPEELRAMSLSDSAPKVTLVTLDGWEEKSRWFYITNEPSFVYTPEIKAAAERIVSGLGSDREKITALNRWVAHNIRYSGLSMGKGEGYTLHPGTMTFRDRCGVCKDKAGMLVTMMRAVGFKETYAAMTMAGARVEDVAADQFNHSVVVWKRPDGGYELLDPTWAPLSRLDWSNAEAEQHYVAGTPQGDVLRITPALRAEDNTLTVRILSRLSKEGDIAASFNIAGTGYMETCLRRWFGFAQRSAWADNLAATARRAYGGASVTSGRVVPEAVEDLQTPFAVAFSLEAPGVSAGSGAQLLVLRPASVSFPLAEERSRENLLPGKVTGRKRGLSFRCAKRIAYEESVELGGTYLLVDWKDLEVVNDLGRVSLTAKTEGGKLLLKLQADFHTRSVPVESLPLYQELLDGLERVKSCVVVLARRAK